MCRRGSTAANRKQGAKMHQISGKRTAVPRVPDSRTMGLRRIEKYAGGGTDE